MTGDVTVNNVFERDIHADDHVWHSEDRKVEINGRNTNDTELVNGKDKDMYDEW